MRREDQVAEVFTDKCMTISDVIAVLDRIRGEHGDIECVVPGFDGGDFEEANRFTVVNAKRVPAEARREIGFGHREAPVKAAHDETRDFRLHKVLSIAW